MGILRENPHRGHGIALASRLIPESRRLRLPVDILGAVAATAGMASHEQGLASGLWNTAEHRPANRFGVRVGRTGFGGPALCGRHASAPPWHDRLNCRGMADRIQSGLYRRCRHCGRGILERIGLGKQTEQDLSWT